MGASRVLLGPLGRLLGSSRRVPEGCVKVERHLKAFRRRPVGLQGGPPIGRYTAVEVLGGSLIPLKGPLARILGILEASRHQGGSQKAS